MSDIRASGKIHRFSDSNVRCPLCLGFFEKMYDGIRRIFIYACHKDQIAIACNDPFVGKWERATKGSSIPCPNCNADMRFFATSTGFMKANCYKKGCYASISKTEPDRPLGVVGIPARLAKHDPGGAIDRPVATPDDISGVPFKAEPGQDVTQ